jgi:hypothetical protein
LLQAASRLLFYVKFKLLTCGNQPFLISITASSCYALKSDPAPPPEDINEHSSQKHFLQTRVVFFADGKRLKQKLKNWTIKFVQIVGCYTVLNGNPTVKEFWTTSTLKKGG